MILFRFFEGPPYEIQSFFSRKLVAEANSKLARRKGSLRNELPLEVGDIIYSNHQSAEEIRSAFEAASARLRKA